MIPKTSWQISRTLNTLRILRHRPAVQKVCRLPDGCQGTPFSHSPAHCAVQSHCFSDARLLRADSRTMYEGECAKAQVVDYQDVRKAQEEKDTLIIDVRENNEIQETGRLPGSVHIPMAEVAGALTALSEEEFKRKFDREKPAKDTRIILSCRSGRRSAMVQEAIQKLGFVNVYNYAGGWMDWESKQKG